MQPKTRNIITVLAAVFTSSLLLMSCSVRDNVYTGDDKDKDLLSLNINGHTYNIDASVTDTLDLLSLSTEFDAQVSVCNANQYDDVSVNGISLKNGVGNIPVENIAKNQFLLLNWSAGKKQHTVYLRTLHNDIPEATVSGTATAPGHFYLSFVYLRLIEKMDNNGNLLFYRYDPIPMADLDGNKSIGWWDFKKHVVGNHVYYSYHASDPKYYDQSFTGFNPGMRIITDEHYNPIDTLRLLPSRDGFVKKGDPIDGHDFYFFDLNHYIMSAYILRDGVYATYLQEAENGQVVFDWWSTEHPDMAKPLDPTFEESAGADYVHFNSIDILPDGNWLCSFRHVSSLLKLDRVGGTGNVLWRILGTDLDDGADFHGEHYARWHDVDSTITLFNNNNGVFKTRMLRLKVDVNTGEVKNSVTLLDDGYFAAACGSLSFSGDNMIVGWGIPGNKSATSDRILSEYDANGTEIFSLRRKSDDVTLNQFLSTYRCVKCQ